MDENKTELEFEYKGYKCKVVMTPMGHRCGYVGVRSGHIASMIESYDDIPVSIHGGCTYGSWEGKKFFWVGFDCAHCDDTPKKWTLEAVKKEVEYLAEQLSKITWKEAVDYKLEYLPAWFRERVKFNEMSK